MVVSVVKRIRMVIADSNVDYLESFSSFMRHASEGDRFIISYFSETAKLQSFIEQNDSIDILLTTRELFNNSIPITGDATIIYLDDDVVVAHEESHSVYRYQRLNVLVSNILSIYYEENEHAGRMLARSRKAKVISVYSPSGGTGKSTVAANMSKQLALRNYKVFYLNLELLQSTELFFSSEADNPSLQLFYYVKAKSPQLLSKIESLKKYDPYSMVDYFDFELNALEMLELNSEDVERLLNGIVETGTYDFIIIDLDSSLHERNQRALLESDQIIWLLSNDAQSVQKVTSILEAEEKIFGKENILKDKSTFIVNKFTNEVVQAARESELVIEGYLPFVQEWITLNQSAEVLNHELFNQEVQAILQDKVIREQEGVQ